MTNQSKVRTLYRAVKKNPPSEKDYITRQERTGDPPPDCPPEVRRSWDALSFYNTPEGVRKQAAIVPAIGRFVARYDIPEGIGITFEETVEPGHFDVRGEKEILKRCWTGDIEPIEEPPYQKASTR